jgi:Protein of unknown function (DUF3108)
MRTPLALAVATLIGLADTALAQGKLEAHYGITFARVSVGEITATVALTANEYSIAANGNARGIIKALISGEGELNARGAIEDSRPVPTEYSSRLKAENGTAAVTMELDHGQIKQLAVTPAGANGGAVTDAIQGIMDPLTALLMPSAAGEDSLSADACKRTVAVFDGHQRYDLKFAFKRLDKASESKRAYSGPTLVCSLSYEPVGLQQPDPLGKYLSDGRDMEIAFVALAGTPVLAPVRFSVSSMLAALVVEADRFAWTAARAN